MKKKDYIKRIIWCKHGIANPTNETVEKLGYSEMKIVELKQVLNSLYGKEV